MPSDLSLELGYIYYSYVSESDLRLQRGQGRAHLEDLTVGVNYSWEYLGRIRTVIGDVDFFYYFANYNFALPATFTLGLHVALNAADGDENNIAFEAEPENEYTEWKVGLARRCSG